MEILHPRVQRSQVVQLVVVRGEERLGTLSKLVDVLYDGPSDGHAVVRGGSAANLVQQHQRAIGQVVQDHRRFQHLPLSCKIIVYPLIMLDSVIERLNDSSNPPLIFNARET